MHQVGTFAPTGWVFIDHEVLSTLGHREWSRGWVKSSSMVSSKIRNFGKNWKTWMVLSESILEHAESIISHSCLVSHGGRQAGQWHSPLSQFWSPVGHAIEATAGYGQVMHGGAVSMGMVQLSHELQKKRLMPKGTLKKSKKCYAENLAFRWPMSNGIKKAPIKLWPMTKKKPVRTSLKLVVVPSWGKAAIHQILFKKWRTFFRKKGIRSYRIFNSRRVHGPRLTAIIEGSLVLPLYLKRILVKLKRRPAMVVVLGWKSEVTVLRSHQVFVMAWP